MLRAYTSSMVVELSTGGVSLILTDVRFRSFSQNQVTNLQYMQSSSLSCFGVHPTHSSVQLISLEVHQYDF